MTPELAPPLLTTTPHQREDVSALDRFSVHRCPTRRVFSGTGLELVTKPATIRCLYHSATAATPVDLKLWGNLKLLVYPRQNRLNANILFAVSRSLPPNYYGHLALADKRCGNSSLFINSWEGISDLGPRRHKETHQQCILFAPDPVTTAGLETHNVYPDISAHGARAGMRWNRWDRLRNNSSKEPSPIGAEKGQSIKG
ncbi:uncharacterized protein TNCV_4928021 [Trichonephila clavipes]|nr:uncharacterized protein TNCV_4928021 [Trichonephila clavipes]